MTEEELREWFAGSEGAQNVFVSILREWDEARLVWLRDALIARTPPTQTEREHLAEIARLERLVSQRDEELAEAQQEIKAADALIGLSTGETELGVCKPLASYTMGADGEYRLDTPDLRP